MMHPRTYARTRPDHLCAIEHGSGRVRTYAELEERANKIAHLFRENGLGQGSTIAFLVHDCLEVFDLAWAAQRSGIYFLPVYWDLPVDEAAWMIAHADAQMLFYGEAFAAKANSIEKLLPETQLISIHDPSANGLEALIASFSGEPIADEMRGLALQYTGGTTGRPKGVRRELHDQPIDAPDMLLPFAVDRFGFRPDMRFSTTAPMYHVAPLKLSMIVHALGGTNVLLGDFAPEAALAALQQHRITHSHWVPHMFVEMVKLSENVREGYDLSALECAVHAAAPCPPSIKQELIDWWGPIVHEIYAGTEGVGFCMINSQEWQAKRGSVGQSVVGKLHILRSDGSEAEPGEIGEVWFEDPLPFAYHKDPERTAQAHNSQGWVTMDDLGFVDEDGFLFLRDRKTTVLSTGAHTLYPREIEDALIAAPEILDVGIGLVELRDGGLTLAAGYKPRPDDDPSATAASLAQLSSRLPAFAQPAHFCPVSSFPRDADGKLDRVALVDALKLAISQTTHSGA